MLQKIFGRNWWGEFAQESFWASTALFLQIFQGCSLQKDHQFELVVFLVYTSVLPFFNSYTFPFLKLAAELLLTWHLTRSVRDPRKTHFCRRDFGSYVLGMVINPIVSRAFFLHTHCRSWLTLAHILNLSFPLGSYLPTAGSGWVFGRRAAACKNFSAMVCV